MVTILEAIATGRTPATPKFTPPPIFNPCFDVPASFIRQYDQVATSNGWNDAYKIQYFGSYLQGAANIWYCNYVREERNQDKTWKHVTEDFIKEFSGEQPLRKLKLKLNARKQLEGEDIKKYLYDLIVLANEVNPDMPFETFREHFENGLHFSYYESYFLMSNGIKTYQELKALIIKLSDVRERILEMQQTLKTNILTLNHHHRNIMYPNSYFGGYHRQDNPKEQQTFTGRNYYYQPHSSHNGFHRHIETSNWRINTQPVLIVKGKINRTVNTEIILDTGTSKNVISRKFVEETLRTKITQPKEKNILQTAGGFILNPTGEVQICINFAEYNDVCTALVVEDLPKPVILGTTFLKRNNAILDFNRSEVIFGTNRKNVRVKFQGEKIQPQSASTTTANLEQQNAHTIRTEKDYLVRPNVEIKVKLEHQIIIENTQNWIFEENDFLKQCGFTAKSMPFIEGGNTYIKLKLKQPNKRQKIYKGTIIGYIRANKQQTTTSLFLLPMENKKGETVTKHQSKTTKKKKVEENEKSKYISSRPVQKEVIKLKSYSTNCYSINNTAFHLKSVPAIIKKSVKKRYAPTKTWGELQKVKVKSINSVNKRTPYRQLIFKQNSQIDDVFENKSNILSKLGDRVCKKLSRVKYRKQHNN